MNREDYNGFISGDGWEGCTDQDDAWDAAMKEGYYGA